MPTQEATTTPLHWSIDPAEVSVTLWRSRAEEMLRALDGANWKSVDRTGYVRTIKRPNLDSYKRWLRGSIVEAAGADQVKLSGPRGDFFRLAVLTNSIRWAWELGLGIGGGA